MGFFAQALLAVLPLVSIHGRDVTSVAIQVDIGAPGSGVHYDHVFNRVSNDVFLSPGGTIREEALDHLLGALDQVPTDTFSFGRSWITPQLLQSKLPAAERLLGPYRTNVRVKAAFVKQFLDWDAMRSRCEAMIGNRRAPDRIGMRPGTLRFRVELRTPIEVVGISSESAQSFLVPLYVEDGTLERSTWDPALSRAIYDLLPAGTPLRDVIGGTEILTRWENIAARSHDVQIAETGRDTLAPFRNSILEYPCLPSFAVTGRSI